MAHLLTYGTRASNHTNPAAKALLQVMQRKMSNLCVSVDLTKKQDVLKLVDAVGPAVCLIKALTLLLHSAARAAHIFCQKTHIDIVEDFDADLIDCLAALSVKHDFLIFEDRKFADIGNTVALQYARGIHRIASWAHLTNAHMVPGPGIITGLKSIGLPLGRGLLLLAEMSSAGTLATGAYTQETIQVARANRDFVVGFIAMERPKPPSVGDPAEDFLILTPGVGLTAKGDGMGQQYRTPRDVILTGRCDVIIVGRGIYGSADSAIDVDVVAAACASYRDAAWAAYVERTS